jgi:hypothetical protein
MATSIPVFAAACLVFGVLWDIIAVITLPSRKSTELIPANAAPL